MVIAQRSLLRDELHSLIYVCNNKSEIPYVDVDAGNGEEPLAVVFISQPRSVAVEFLAIFVPLYTAEVIRAINFD